MTETALSTRQTAAEIRALAGRLRRRLREQADAGEFTTAQASVVIRIERGGPATCTELARAEGMKPQSMGPILTSLEEREVLVAQRDPGDGRKTIWSITPEARRSIDRARATKEDWLLRTIESRLTPTEQQQLSAGVQLLTRLLEP
ncbi:MAG TPA: MarR family transcriptional regulator [Pseudolysinimonas sp.]|jgi:DNA-binding MarR family transcriptional regulator